MADDVDRTQARIEREEQLLLAARKQVARQEPATYCHDCGDPIPEKRQKAAPNVRRCIYCQNEIEQRKR